MTRSILPFSSKSLVKNLLVSKLTPMAPNTMLKFSAWLSCVPLFILWSCTKPACRQICAAISLCGRPAAEKMGIFWPRAMEFMVSMAEMPVEIISSGVDARVGVDGRAVDVEVVFREHLGPLVDGAAGAVEDAAQHVFADAELEVVPGEFDFGLGVCQSGNGCVLGSGSCWLTFLTSMPDVPSNTCTTARLPARRHQHRISLL